jgi:DeoR family glycerol-3-phosphate regulon repressor
MLATERHAIILERLAEKPTVSIRVLTEQLGVSRETVRKDIELLAQDQKLEKIRGGATKIRTRELPMTKRSLLNIQGKTQIAQYLATQIPNGASLFLDNGSSVLALAHELINHEGLIVYTNDLKVAEMIAPATNELVIIGGRVDVTEMAVQGAEALENAARYRTDFAVVSAGGLSSTAFLTDFSREAANMRHLMLSHAQQPIMLADSEKFGVVGQVVFDRPPKLTRIITDLAPDDAIQQNIAERGYRLTIVSEV